MPELPEVETVRRGLLPAMEGRIITQARVNRPDLRWPFPPRMAERLTGARVLTLRRRSKYILADLSTDETLLIHLGMSGRMLISPPPPAGEGQGEGVAPDRATLGEWHHHHPAPIILCSSPPHYPDPIFALLLVQSQPLGFILSWKCCQNVVICCDNMSFVAIFLPTSFFSLLMTDFVV